MHLPLWKPIAHCAALILETKNKWREKPRKSSVLRQLHETKIKEALQAASEDGSLSKPQENSDQELSNSMSRSRSLARLHVQREFLRATSLAADQIYTGKDSIPDLHSAFSKFLTMYPKFQLSQRIDQLRLQEYEHLSESSNSTVCLDYCGFGLFSYHQTQYNFPSSSFSLSEITANVRNQAIHGGYQKGTVEHHMKTRIMEFLNIPESEYGIVFTVSRGSAFKLLAESYPFRSNKKLLTMFDHESQSVNWMTQCAKTKGAKTSTASFKWPSFRICSTHLKKQISIKRRRKKKNTGLFVFPVQSRVTGAKYSYQWMALAQQNNWHVLLDAGALGPKDMDSLGLSLFRPDFIITSFYRVFGFDPTGFGCLLIKKSVISELHNGNGQTGSGMVRILPVSPQYYLSDSIDDIDITFGIQDTIDEERLSEKSPMPAFSGAFTSSQLRDITENKNASEKDEAESSSMGDVMKSPIFSEDDSSDNSYWIDLGHSPFGNSVQMTIEKADSLARPKLKPRWFSNSRFSPKLQSKISNPLYNHNFSFDAALLAASQEEESQVKAKSRVGLNESCIRRETEGEFRLLGGRGTSRVFGMEEDDQHSSTGHNHNEESLTSIGDNDEEDMSDEWESRAIETSCRHLEHINMLGLNKTTLRLRYLINWLVTSLVQLRFQSTVEGEVGATLVHIYGPKIKYERGGALAFNIRETSKGPMIHPEMVQKLAEKYGGLSVGIGILSNVKGFDQQVGDEALRKPVGRISRVGKNECMRIEVVTVSLGFLSNFEDVYKMWVFVAKFLDPSFAQQYTETLD